jgi:hypothetical protein
MPQTLLAKQQMCQLRLREVILQVHSQKLSLQVATCSLAATALLLLEIANCKKLRCKASLDHVGDNKLQAAQLPLHPQNLSQKCASSLQQEAATVQIPKVQIRVQKVQENRLSRSWLQMPQQSDAAQAALLLLSRCDFAQRQVSRRKIFCN